MLVLYVGEILSFKTNKDDGDLGVPRTAGS